MHVAELNIEAATILDANSMQIHAPIFSLLLNA
jgi:hypothetical protein